MSKSGARQFLVVSDPSLQCGKRAFLVEGQSLFDSGSGRETWKMMAKRADVPRAV
jgi:hypothetical protein